jgi:ribonuclease BN (tRNA processing enzyme)
MKLTLLGTGAPEPSVQRQSSGYILEIGKDKIVFDAGPGSYLRFLQAGYKPTDVTGIFFTHFHYDHCIEYATYLLQHWDMGAGHVPQLNVYGPRPLALITEKLIGPEGVYSYDLRARTEHPASIDVFEKRGGKIPRLKPKPAVREVKPGDMVSGEGWKVTVGEAFHFQPLLECYAYRIDSPTGSLCYSGDSGADCPGMVGLAKDANVLIHMMQFETAKCPSRVRGGNGTHLDVAKIAADASVGTLVLTHIGPSIDRPDTLERLRFEMAEIYKGRIIWGEDLLTIDVTR